MNGKSCIFLLCICALCLLSCSCGPAEPARSALVVASWNVQCMFDDLTEGTEYSDFQNSALWDHSAYRNRVRNLASAITALDPRPDLLVLQEVENDRVLYDLCSLLASKGYLWYGTTAGAGRAIQTGFIARVPVDRDDVAVIGVEGQRPILRIRLVFGGADVVVLGFHAKSRSDGPEETEPDRLATSAALICAAAEASALYPGAVVLLAGDFNTDINCSAALLQKAPGLCPALAYAGWDDAVLSGCAGSLVVTGGPPAAGCWYSFWEDEGTQKEAPGSYVYRGEWYCFDRILCGGEAFDREGPEYDGGGVYTGSGLTDGQGLPGAYVPRLRSGLSDHLPVWVRLTSFVEL